MQATHLITGGGMEVEWGGVGWGEVRVRWWWEWNLLQGHTSNDPMIRRPLTQPHPLKHSPSPNSPKLSLWICDLDPSYSRWSQPCYLTISPRIWTCLGWLIHFNDTSASNLSQVYLHVLDTCEMCTHMWLPFLHLGFSLFFLLIFRRHLYFELLVHTFLSKPCSPESIMLPPPSPDCPEWLTVYYSKNITAIRSSLVLLLFPLSFLDRVSLRSPGWLRTWGSLASTVLYFYY